MAASAELAPAPVHLTCEHHVDPLGIGDMRPRLSWQLPVTHRGVRQVAYELLVASSRELLDRDEGDLWSPGRVAGEDNVLVAYDGLALVSRQRCHWKVRAWDERDVRSGWSEPAWWEMGLLGSGDWKARWIGIPRPPLERDDFRPGPLLRREFSVDGEVACARLYASGLGLYRASLNGGTFDSGADRPFAPGWTDYDHRVQFQTYDVTSALHVGANALGVALGEGWYAGHVGNADARGYWGSELKALVQLEIEYADGRRQLVCSDESWHGALGPLVVSDLMTGEEYDARAERPEWDCAGEASDDWEPVRVLDPPRGRLVAQRGRPTRRLRELAPVARTAPLPFFFVYDFGQCIGGRVRLKLEGPAGTEIMIRHGERLNADGTVYTGNLMWAFATDRYILKGDGVEVWEPSFTIHSFRYIEVWGHPLTDPPDDTVTAVAIGSDLDPAGTFRCSNEQLNKLHEAIVWTYRSNSVEVPTDNPNRPERLGWLGDAAAFAPTALLIAHAAPLYTKWLDDVRDGISSRGEYPNFAPTVSWPERSDSDADGLKTPGAGAEAAALDAGDPPGAPGWGDAGVLIPWLVYEATGDPRLLADHYDAMARWADLIADENPDLIRRNMVGNDYGDWLSFPQADGEGRSPLLKSAYSTSPRPVLATAWFFRVADILARAANVLGRAADAQRFATLAAAIGEAYRRELLDDEGRIEGGTQTTYAQALSFGLVEGELRERVGDRLEDAVHLAGDRISTGIQGTGHLLPMLAATGRVELAYTLLLNDDVPSWLWMLRNDATTIWERWDGVQADGSLQDIAMNSFNQPTLGSVGAWLYEGIAGIARDPEGPGYRRFVVHPRPGGGLTSAAASHASPHGEIRSAWELDGDRFALEIDVPAGTTATVRLPAGQQDDVREGATAAEAADGVRLLERGEREAAYEVRAGTYRFTVVGGTALRGEDTHDSR
jgi:alpha-L-rhamnosidase